MHKNILKKKNIKIKKSKFCSKKNKYSKSKFLNFQMQISQRISCKVLFWELINQKVLQFIAILKYISITFQKYNNKTSNSI